MKVAKNKQTRKHHAQESQSDSFQASLFRFLAEDLSPNEYFIMLKTNELYFGLDESKKEGKYQESIHSSTTPGPGPQIGSLILCNRYYVVDGQMTSQDISDLIY